jgi:quercetin dioxygenase-like cupin family protein
MLKRVSLYAVALALVFISAAYAQQTSQPSGQAPPPITRTILQTANFPGDQYQTIQAYVVIAPGALVARHTHPGVELGYVLDGELDLFVQGQPVKHLKTGDSFENPAGVPHSVRNTNTDKPTKILSTYVVDKSKPLASAAPE